MKQHKPMKAKAPAKVEAKPEQLPVRFNRYEPAKEAPKPEPAKAAEAPKATGWGPAPKAEAPKPAPAPAAEPKAEKPKALMVTIAGKGTVPIFAAGAMRRIACGKAVEVSKAEFAYIKNAGVSFS